MFLRKTLSVCAVLFATLAPARAEKLFAIDSRAVLVGFDSARPATVLSMAVVRGLQPGETIVGIDFRPANKKLYALGSSSRLYILDPASGAATAVGSGPFLPALSGTKFGFNFNPTVDRIRIVSNTGQNLRVHPDTGLVVAVDGFLKYNDDAVPQVVACAYTNSVAGATSTTLFDFDLNRRAITTQNPPNEGNLTVNFQLRGADFSEVTGFDISPTGNKGYLATRETSSARSQLYEINFAMGSATLIGTAGVLDQISALAVEPPGVPSLFTRLGGMAAVEAVIDEFLKNVVSDVRINRFFSQTVATPARVAALRQNLIDQVCAGSGGPCEYKGLDMKTAHRGMNISDVEFDALVADLVKALDRFQVPTAEKAALLGILAPMRGDIVESRQMMLLEAGR
jgi:truncated hemoglobin YjbI